MEMTFGIVVAVLAIVTLVAGLHMYMERIQEALARRIKKLEDFTVDEATAGALGREELDRLGKRIERLESAIHKVHGKFGAMARIKTLEEAKAAAVETDSTADTQEAPKPELKLVKKYGDPEFSRRLRNLVAKRDTSPAQLAEDVGVTYNAVWNWLNGCSLPNSDNAIALASKLGVNVDYLIHGDPRAKMAAKGC